MKKLLHPALWIIAGAVLLHSTIYIELSCNLFSWNPDLDWETALAIATVIVIEIFIFWLTRKLKNTSAIITSLLVCIVLAVFGAIGFIALQGETVSKGQGLGILVSRSTLSPLWYKITFLTLHFIPLFTWISHMYKQQIKLKKS